MAPEYSKAAGNLSPLVPFYAIDCDAESNKQLCASQVSKRPSVSDERAIHVRDEDADADACM